MSCCGWHFLTKALYSKCLFVLSFCFVFAFKAGVIGLTRSNAKEFSSRNILVNCVCPGYIATDMVEKLDEAYLEKVSELIPLKRLGKPEEVAGMCRFLALDPAVEYITGHTFNVDGGIAIGC